MTQALLPQVQNTNPSRFEELAGVLASVVSYFRDNQGLRELEKDFQHLYQRALSQPPCYSEVNELTGQCLNAGDRMAGRAAWLLPNLENLRIYGVHSLLWHEVQGEYSAPLLQQMASALGVESRLSAEDVEHMAGDKKALIDVIGVKDGESIWIVQTLARRSLLESAVSRSPYGSHFLFKTRVFNDPVLSGQPLKTLYKADYMMRRAMPTVPVHLFCLVMHPRGPDFELYRVELPKGELRPIILSEKAIVSSSLHHADRLQDNPDALLALPHKLDNDLFRGLPPCRGGRTLGILASTAKRQLESDDLLRWRQGDIARILDEDFTYQIPRDKVRHDLDDRLVGNGFMRKNGGDYSLTIKGIARYLYCLAKYTTLAVEDHMLVLNECIKQRDRILRHYHCL
jgi:hypothetical protein